MTSSLFSFTFSNPLVSGFLALMIAITHVISAVLIFESVRNWGKPRLAQGMLAGLLLILLILMLFLGITAALILTGHAP